jgi:CBS domain-containing protein
MKINTDAPKFMDRPISQFMTPSPVTLETSDKIAFALQKMNVGGYRHLPILFQGKLAGVISIRDILRYLTERIGAVAGRR